MSEKRLSFCSLVCDKALPLPCCVSPGETLTSLSPGSSRSAGGQPGHQLDLNAVSSTEKEAKEEIRAREEEGSCG